MPTSPNPATRLGTAVQNPAMPTNAWRAAIDAWCVWLMSTGKSLATRKLRRYHLDRFSRGAVVGPFDTTHDDIVTMLAHPNWAAETRRSALSSLRSFYAWAHASGRIDHNPAALVPTIPVKPGSPRPAPESALRAALESADERVRLMVSLAAYEGLRRGEICRVHADDITQAIDGTWELTVHGKGGKRRVVPLVDDIARRLRTHAAEHGGGFVFPGQINGHLSAPYVGKLMSRCLPGDWTAHTLRHRFASAAYAAERDIRAVQELLGHSDVRTTQIYTAVPADAKRRAVLGASLMSAA